VKSPVPSPPCLEPYSNLGQKPRAIVHSTLFDLQGDDNADKGLIGSTNKAQIALQFKKLLGGGGSGGGSGDGGMGDKKSGQEKNELLFQDDDV
jgi:hypothetical protein